MIDHIEAAIVDLEAAKNAAKEMYFNTCSESCRQGTTANDGDSRFLLMIQMLDLRIASLDAILEELQIFG